jgi:penicillin-binding protein 1A
MHARRGSLVAGFVGLALIAALASGCRLPDLHADEELEPELAQTSFLYDARGRLITRFHAEEDRVPVTFERIPPHVRDAVVAIEDRRFYQHRGVDLRAVLRAVRENYRSGEVVEGGSTITQQYVKNALIGGSERTLARKLREAVLAWQLEKDLSKDEILTRYLNTVYFGRGAYGIQAAAKTYFSKSVWQLTVPEAALLAGLIATPGHYDPVDHPGRARFRRNTVLVEMLEVGKLDREAFEAARRSGLRLHLPPATERFEAAYFVDLVKRWFLESRRFGETYTQRYNLLFKGGLRIHTSIDLDLQRAAEDAVGQVLAFRGDPHAAMAVVDPRTGHLRALVGGRDFFSQTDPVAQVNLATGHGGNGRPAGSAFKPFALVAALEQGISPQRLYPSPSSMTFQLPRGSTPPTWSPSNFNGSSYGTITLEQATIDSVNVAYAQVIRDLGEGDLFLGAAEMVRTARRMGVRSELDAVPSAVLGINAVTPLEMASAYVPLANGGTYVPPVAVTRIEDAEGRLVYRARPKARPAIRPPIAYVANQILQKVVQLGTGTSANIGRPVFGKTGTGQDHRDAWFVGGIPQLVTAVWVGFPRARVRMEYPRVRISAVTGGSWPAQIWRIFMLRATRGMAIKAFPQSVSEYVELDVDITRGCLPNRFTPPSVIRTVRYLSGTQPTRTCTEPREYQPLDVPSVIGLSAEDAEDLLEDSGFLVAVEEARSGQPAGTVIAQIPAAGEQALQASTVTIRVAVPRPPPKGQTFPVPDVTGLPEADAVATLEGAGFAVQVLVDDECQPDDAGCDAVPGIVWKQSPRAGGQADEGSTVRIRVNP